MTTRVSVGVGIVGAGFLAETRARCYRQVVGVDARLAAVTSRTRARAEDYARRHGVAVVTDTLDELLARADVDVVDLCVPNLAHRPLAVAAAAAGKHVICTKPLTAYVGQDLAPDATEAEVAAVAPADMLRVVTEDADAMQAAARDAGVQLMYGENWVYAPSIVRARELLAASGAPLLEMRGWECHNGSHSPYSKVWRATGGGALLRLGAHPIGAMVDLKRAQGVRPVAVLADVADLTRNPALTAANTRIASGWQDVENWGCAVLTFEDGARGVAYGSDNMLGGMESKLELLASNCHLKCNLSPNDLLRAYAPDGAVFGDSYIMEKVDSGAGWTTPMPSEDWSSGQLAMLQDFVEAVAENRAARSDGALGCEVTRILYAAYQSAREGRRIELAGA